LIQPKNVYSLFRRMQTELGLENEDFITDPTSSEFDKATEGDAQPDPYIAGEKLKAESRMREKQIDAQIKAAELAQERDLAITKMEVESGVDLAKAGIGAEVALARGAQQARGRGGAAPREPAPTGSVQ